MRKRILSIIFAVFIVLSLSIEAFAAGNYVASRKSNVFHKASCSYVDQIYSSNKVYYNTPQDAIKAGKRGCYRCHPENDVSKTNTVSNQDDYNRGYKVGKDIGYQNGYSAGTRDGYKKGKTEWYDKRYNEGYEAGYHDAVAELEPKYKKEKDSAYMLFGLTAVAFIFGYPYVLDEFGRKKKT